MEIEIAEREPQRYAYLRHLGPYPQIGSTFGRMAEIAGGAGLLGPNTRFIGVYHDDPSSTPPEALRSDAGVTLSGEVPLTAGLEEATLAGGRYAKGVHRGSYAKMGESWMAFFDAIHAAGLKPRMAPPFELYISDMDTTPEDELITELYAGVESP